MVLVTGATGFLGTALCLQLTRAQPHFLALKRASGYIPETLAGNTQIEWVDGDLLDEDALEKRLTKVTQIYHCAAIVSFHPDKDQEMFDFNVQGTKNLVAACLKHNIRLVHVSSVAVFDDPAVAGAPTTEKDYPAVAPATHPYGLSKYLSEQAVWEGISNGLNAVIVNPSIIVGPVKNYGGSGAFFSVVRDGLKFYTSGGAGFVAVEDVAACMIKLMASDIRAERFIISGENLSYKQLFTMIANAYGIKPPPIKASRWMLEIGWRLMHVLGLITGKTPSFTRATANSSLNVSLYDNKKIIQATGHQFMSLEKAINNTAKSYQQLN